MDGAEVDEGDKQSYCVEVRVVYGGGGVSELVGMIWGFRWC